MCLPERSGAYRAFHGRYRYRSKDFRISKYEHLIHYSPPSDVFIAVEAAGAWEPRPCGGRICGGVIDLIQVNAKDWSSAGDDRECIAG